MREVYGRPEYEVLWRQARTAVARGQVKLGFKAPDPAAAAAVSALIGRPLTAGVGTTIPVADLDAALRAGEFHCGLDEVLAAVHGEPAEFSAVQPSVDASRREWVTEILADALSSVGLIDKPWASLWIDHVRRYAKIPPERLATPAHQAAAILATLTLDPRTPPAEWVTRTALATRHGAGPRGLDRGQKLAGLVLRAAALAHGLDYPRGARDEWMLWERCGVAPDGLSTTVLTLNLPDGLRHVTLRDLPLDRVSTVWVCESPRVIEAAFEAGVRQPMVCLSGYLNIVARQLLAHLGAAVRVHADFDRTGLLLVRQVLELTGGTPWRMSGDDYRFALERARAEDVDLPPLGPDPGPAPWDPSLVEALRAGWAVDEEMTLPSLLDDLTHL
ncbi:TIGR02679 domain-containing protein [Actinokineospora sp. HUAS TT18]|uniref:TIGR02679 domain-containing protein n=1 Tax=Actinokineospora sp. HUAS TT18 TaxID=3447451 RepID=UPI003F528DF5